MPKPRGPSQAMLKAQAYSLKHPELNAEQLAKKFGVTPSTVYRAPWWKTRRDPAKTAAQ